MEVSEIKTVELYFHIPFCIRKCLYCDFLSFPAPEGEREQYMSALIRETHERAEECRGYSVSSLFLGGGTPSLAETAQIEELLRVVKENYTITSDIEYTIEINPGTVNKEKLTRYRRAGVNRISIGLQSADNGELEALGRIHNWQQFLDTYNDAIRAGFENINVDVMNALPGQSVDSCRSTLLKVLSLNPPPAHISSYSLILEEGTPLFAMQEEGKFQLPDEDTDRLMYRDTGKILEQAGYRRYEISNYAKEGFACRHNCGYWRRQNYLGFGVGAASLFNNTRFRNCEDIDRYLIDPLGCRVEVHRLSMEEQMEEFMFLGLRLTEGVSAEEFERCFGQRMETVYGDVIERNIEDGLIQWRNGKETSDHEGKQLSLTEYGIDVSNYVMAQFLLT